MVPSAGSKYWCSTRVWRLDSGPNLQPCLRIIPMRHLPKIGDTMETEHYLEGKKGGLVPLDFLYIWPYSPQLFNFFQNFWSSQLGTSGPPEKNPQDMFHVWWNPYQATPLKQNHIFLTPPKLWRFGWFGRWFFPDFQIVPCLKLAASLHLKMDGWNTMNFPFGSSSAYFQRRTGC